MKAGEYSLENAMEILPDEQRRTLAAEARAYAEAGNEPRTDFGPNYWDVVVGEHKRIVWMDAYSKRKARLERLRQPHHDMRPTYTTETKWAG